MNALLFDLLDGPRHYPQTTKYILNYLFQSLVNLFLTGSAAPYLHNGVIRCDAKGQALQHPMPGIRTRGSIGFLFFNKNENEHKRTEVSIEVWGKVWDSGLQVPRFESSNLSEVAFVHETSALENV